MKVFIIYDFQKYDIVFGHDRLLRNIDYNLILFKKKHSVLLVSTQPLYKKYLWIQYNTEIGDYYLNKNSATLRTTPNYLINHLYGSPHKRQKWTDKGLSSL